MSDRTEQSTVFFHEESEAWLSGVRESDKRFASESGSGGLPATQGHWHRQGAKAAYSLDQPEYCTYPIRAAVAGSVGNSQMGLRRS